MKELRRLLPYLKRHKKTFVIGFIFVTISNICAILVPRYIGEGIDVVTADSYTAADYPTVVEIVGLLLGFSILAGVFMYLTRRTIIVASRRIEYELRRDLVRKMQVLPLSFFHRTPTGELMALGNNDINAAREFIGPAIMYTANTLTRAVFALGMMFLISVKVSLLALLPLPFVSYATYKIGQKVHVLFKSVQEQYGSLTTWTQENLSGVRVVRSYAREDYESERFGLLSKEYLKRNIDLTKAQAAMMPVMMVLIGLSQVIVLQFVGNQIITGEASLGELAQFFMYISLLIWPVISIGWVTNIIQRAAASTARLGRVFDEVPDIVDNETTDHSISDIRGRIEFRNVSFRYEANTPDVLRGISFSIEAGETVGIVGETGAGKSSLINLIPRLYDVSEGSILIDGRDVRTIPLQILRRHISVAPQESFLFSTSIRENVRFGNLDADDAAVEHAAQIAQLDGDVQHFPQGFDTIVGERGITLSGGQKQRTAIARAVIRKPSIIVFDDALSAIDTHTEERILQGLEQVMRERTSIIISHRISTVKNADKIIVLHDNRLAEIGSHEELLALGGHYADMYQRQLLEEEIEQM